MFGLLSNGVVESLHRTFKAKGIPYGFCGIARIGEGTTVCCGATVIDHTVLPPKTEVRHAMAMPLPKEHRKVIIIVLMT